MKTSCFIIAASLSIIATSCSRTYNPEQPSLPEETHKVFTLSFSNVAAAPSAGDTIRYYTSDEAEIKSAAVEQAGTAMNARLELEPGSDYVVAFYGSTTVGAHSRSSITFLDMIPGMQSGAGECSVSVAEASVSDDGLNFVSVTGALSFSVSRSTTRTVRISAPGNSCIHSFPETEFRIDGASVNASAGTAVNDVIAISTPSPGDYNVVLLPGTFAEGITVSCLDVDGYLVSRTKLLGPITLKNDENLHIGIVDAAPTDPEHPEIHYERNDGIEISCSTFKCSCLEPLQMEFTYEGRHYDCEVISNDSTVTYRDGQLIPTATGRHRLTVFIKYNDFVRYFKSFDIEVYSESRIEMLIRAKEGLSPTYGNSEVVLKHDGQLPLTITFGVRVNIAPLIGQTIQEWLFPEQQLSLQPGSEAVLSDYSKLSSIVKNHLTASFSVDIFLNREDEYHSVSFNADNIRLNLMHSLGRTIPFAYNGEKLW